MEKRLMGKNSQRKFACTCVSVCASHMQDGVSVIISDLVQKVLAEAIHELLNVLNIAISAGQKNIVDIIRRRNCQGHDFCWRFLE